MIVKIKAGSTKDVKIIKKEKCNEKGDLNKILEWSRARKKEYENPRLFSNTLIP